MTTTRIRILFLDNLKVLLATLVILVHAAQPYGPGGSWFILPPPVIPLDNVLVIGIFLAVSVSFFMGLFFFISAHFLPGSCDRKGASRFLRERVIRLGIPLLILLLTLVPVINYLFYPKSTSFIDYYLHNTFFTTGNPATLSFDYLWFLVMLIAFGLLYIALRSTRLTLPPVSFPRQSVLLLTAAILGLAYFFVRIWFPLNQWVLFHSVEPAHIPLYFLMFIAGILAFRNHWLDNLPLSTVPLWGAIVIAGALLLLPMYVMFGASDGGFTLGSFLHSLWEAFVGIGMVIVLLTLFKKYLDTTGPVLRVMAENIYPGYFIYLPIVMSLQWLLIPVEIPTLGKFIVVGAISIPLCFLVRVIF
jgi:glucans biosynthesis protein C